MKIDKKTRNQLGICAAKCRSGEICQSTALGQGGRCQLHGGLSTGPKTYEGKKQSALNIGKDYDVLLKIKMERLLAQYARARVNPISKTLES